MKRNIFFIMICVCACLFGLAGCSRKTPDEIDKEYLKGIWNLERVLIIRSEAQKLEGTDFFFYLVGDSIEVNAGLERRFELFSVDSTLKVGKPIKTKNFFFATGNNGLFPAK